MAGMRPLPTHKVIKILKKHGFEEVRSRKHTTFKKIQGSQVLTTWVPHHKEVSLTVIKYIIKQTGIPAEEFR